MPKILRPRERALRLPMRDLSGPAGTGTLVAMAQHQSKHSPTEGTGW